MAGLVEVKYFLDGYKNEWSYGHSDCCLFLADYAVYLGYNDPAYFLRGKYSNKEECKAIIKKHGGLIKIIDNMIEKMGSVSIEAPNIGCIGLIGSPINELRQFGAIFDGNNWYAHAINQTGVCQIAGKVIKMWNV